MGPRTCIALLALTGLLWLAPGAGARTPNVAALQVGLQARGLYGGTIDGIMGPGTRRAVHALQRRAGISVDGVAGPQTKRALGRYARHRVGDRMEILDGLTATDRVAMTDVDTLTDGMTIAVGGE